MPKISFDQLPDEARLWVFGADRPLDEEEERILFERVDAFLSHWKAHGTPLTCGWQWRYDRFLHVAVDERSAPPSGCSIDAMVRILQGLEAEIGIRLTDRAPVWFREDGEIRATSRTDFASLATTQEVGPETVVFDQTVTSIGELRGGAWETEAASTWHGRAFFGLDT